MCIVLLACSKSDVRYDFRRCLNSFSDNQCGCQEVRFSKAGITKVRKANAEIRRKLAKTNHSPFIVSEDVLINMSEHVSTCDYYG